MCCAHRNAVFATQVAQENVSEDAISVYGQSSSDSFGVLGVTTSSQVPELKSDPAILGIVEIARHPRAVPLVGSKRKRVVCTSE